MQGDTRRRTRAWRRLAALTAAGLMLALPARADIIDRVLAVVGGDVILLSDVRAVTTLGLMPDARDEPDVLSRLIDRTLILAEVNRFVVPEPDAAVVEREVALLRARFASPDRFREALEAVGLTEISVARLVRDNRRIDSYLAQRFGSAVQPTEVEVARFYRDHEDLYTVGEEPQPFEVVREQVRRDLQEARRLELIADWVVRLRQRASVSRLDGGD